MKRHVDWSEQWGEWIIVTEGIGQRHYFDCKAEADEYLRITAEQGHSDPYVWRRLGEWCKHHKHGFYCKPQWERGNTNANTN